MPADDQLEIPVVWVEPDDPRAQWVNQIVSVFQADEFTISLGQLSPPIILGENDDDRRERARNIPFVQVQTIAKVVMTRRRVEELIRVLQENLQKHDAATGHKP